MVYINKILDIEIEKSEPVVSLDEAKTFIRQTTDEDDVVLSFIIDSCQARLEQFTGISFNQRTVKVQFTNYYGSQELPYGPVVSITSLKDQDDNDITDYKLDGLQFKLLRSVNCGLVKAEYTSGYTEDNLPQDLKLALLNEIAFRFEHRGDQADIASTLSPTAYALARPHKRYRFI